VGDGWVNAKLTGKGPHGSGLLVRVDTILELVCLCVEARLSMVTPGRTGTETNKGRSMYYELLMNTNLHNGCCDLLGHVC
jgi:hypothetical protein